MSILEKKDIKASQNKLMDILVDFDKVCREKGIEYFLAGGTLLGAVRHEGFLPWDDDIDLYIRASEWNAKKDILKEALPSQYAIVSEDYNELYCNPVVRIVDKRTTQISRSRLTDRSEHGVLIDIFLLDPIPDDELEYEKYIEDFWAYSEIKTPTMKMDNSGVTVNDSMERKYREALERVKVEGRDTVIAEMEKALLCYDEKECSRYHLRWGGYWVDIPASAFRTASQMSFEGVMFPIPCDYPQVLFAEYGDTWMMIPEGDKVWTHDSVENLNVPYDRYDREIAEAINLDEYREIQMKNKNYKMERQFMESRLRKKYIADKDVMAKAVLTNDNGISKYVDIQKQLFKDHHIIDVDDDFLTRVLREAVAEGDLDFIRGIDKYYKGKDDAVLEILEDVREIRRIRYSYYLGQGEDNLEEAVRLAQKYEGQINLIEFVCQIQTQQGQIDDDLESLIAQSLVKHGNRPRLMKISADINMTHGHVEQAKAGYDEILSSSSDGMVNKEIREILRREFL